MCITQFKPLKNYEVVRINLSFTRRTIPFPQRKLIISFLNSYSRFPLRVLLFLDRRSESICKAAQEHDVDAIVMGSRGENTASRMSLGSVSTYALHHASVPVIIVPRMQVVVRFAARKSIGRANVFWTRDHVIAIYHRGRYDHSPSLASFIYAAFEYKPHIRMSLPSFSLLNLV